MLAKCAHVPVRSSSARTVKALIVNADDFGSSREVNAAVLRAHREGILTSASLMVAEPHAEEAARIARDNPSLDVGLHAVVCKGRGIRPHAEIAPIVDAAGRFPESPALTGLRLYFDKSLRAKLAAELRAQVERHLELVGYLNHIDGHLNFHVHPVVADILVDLAAEFRVPCIRLPRERLLNNLRVRRDHAMRKMVEGVIFRSLSRRTYRRMGELGLKTTDRLIGLFQSGHLDQDYVVTMISRLLDGTTEFYFHPSMDIGATPPSPSAQIEAEILVSPGIRAALDAHSVALTTFAELARKPS
jgi:hopanoid biosynthesis associated protein HpnK